MSFCPPEVAEQSAQYKGRMNKPKFLYTYNEYLAKEAEKMEHKRATCDHPTERLVVVCLHCKEHLEATKKHPALVRIEKVS